jgi:hypothetical protein
VTWHPLAAKRNQARGRVDACHDQPTSGHVEGDGRARTAPEVKHACACWQGCDEPIVPRLIAPDTAPPVCIPSVSMPFIVGDDAVRQICHEALRLKAVLPISYNRGNCKLRHYSAEAPLDTGPQIH